MAEIDDLLARMSLREKVGQLNQRLYGWQCVRRGAHGWELTETFHREVEHWSGLGALYGLFRADAWSGRDWDTGVRPEERAEVAVLVLDAVRQQSPYGIAPLLVEEAPHGHQALGGPLLATNLSVGASWDPDLYAHTVAEVSATMRADGVHLALVSALDLLRDPRWGRSEECYGEDPGHAAAFAAALVCGMQGADRVRIREGSGVGVVLKHFAAQGEGVGGRNGHSAQLGPRDLAELHLPAARAGVAAGAVGVMAAYNDIDGVPCLADRGLLTGLLREAWGFDGVVMADGKAVDRLIEQVGSAPAAAATALDAGVDLSLWDESYAEMERAVEQLPDLATAVDTAVRRVLGVKAAFGLLGGADGRRDGVGGERIRSADAPGGRADAVGQGRGGREQSRSCNGGRPDSAATIGGRDSASRARILGARLAERSVVLLADRGVLPHPFTSRARWVVTGPHADLTTSLLGDYVPPLAPQEHRSILRAVRERGAAAGAQVVGTSPTPRKEDFAGADLVVVVLGGTSHRSAHDDFAENGAVAGRTQADCGEGVDRADLRLPGGQEAFLQRVRAATRAPVVAVVVAGRPYVLTQVLAAADATLFAGYPGPAGADAIARILCGDIQPVGRLAVSFPAHPGVVPARADERLSPDGVYHDQPGVWAASFGAGVGYASVHMDDSRAQVRGESVHVEADLVGGAPVPGWDGPAEEVLRIQLRRFGGRSWPRRQELAAFRRVALALGAVTTVACDLPASEVFVAAGDAPALARRHTELWVQVGTQMFRHELTPDHSAAPVGGPPVIPSSATVVAETVTRYTTDAPVAQNQEPTRAR